MKNKTKKEHFLPITYQKFFADKNGLVYSYDLELSGKELYVIPRHICYENDMYENRCVNGEYINLNKIENTLREIEGQYATVIKKLQKRVIKQCNQKSIVNHDEHAILINMISVQLLRTKEIFELSKGQYVRLVKKFISNCDIAFIKDIAQRFVLPSTNEDALLQHIFKTIICKNHLSVGVCGTPSLITCDNPVITLPHIRGVTIIFPISPYMAIFLTPGKQKTNIKTNIFKLSKKDVCEINQHIAKRTNRHIISKFPIERPMIQKYISLNQERKNNKRNKKP